MRTEIVFPNKLHSSSFIKKGLKPTSTTIFDKPLPSNVEVNNVSNFMAYFVGRHRVLLASEDY